MTARKTTGSGKALAGPDEFTTAAAEMERAVAYFREAFPDEWRACRLWPTESGLIHIAEKLKG